MSENAEKRLWWQQGVVYQIYPRSFKDTTGDGIGDLEGIIEKLDYLNDGTANSLGIDAIWISPFYPSPMADFGYDVADYCNVDPLFGDLSTFDRLVTEAHRRGIKIIIDYVPNHTSDQHPWFLESRSSRSNPKRDWYIWRDAKSDGSLPNNWGSAFGGPAWTWDETTRQYYFHHFLKEQPELNWRNQEVRKAMLDVLHFWLKRGVDGFRMDVVGFLIKDYEMRDNPPNLAAPRDLHLDDLYGRQLHIYNEDQDEVHEIMREFRRLLNQYEERCVIGELGYALDRWLRYYGETGEGLHMPFNFRLIEQPWEARAIRESVEHLEASLPAFAWPNYVLGNHDNPRLASRIGEAQARVAAMLLLTLRGTPTLYYGDELGVKNGIIPADKMKDPQGLRLGPQRSRDLNRTPMQWNKGLYAGFSSSEPWLPVSGNYEVVNVEAESHDPVSLLNLCRNLIWFRRRTPALQDGSYRSVEIANDNCYAYIRSHPSRTYLVALNFSERPQTLNIDEGEKGTIKLSTHLDREEIISLSTLHLRPDEGVVIELL